jgi:hypothetical protein
MTSSKVVISGLHVMVGAGARDGSGAGLALSVRCD